MAKDSKSLENTFLKIAIVVILLMCLVGYCSIKEKYKKEQKTTINSYSALLTDTLEKIESENDTIWLQPINQITPEDIYNSDIYKNLTKEQQKTVKELKKNKDLLAALNISIITSKQETQKLIDSLSIWSVSDTIFMAPDGTLLIFSDTTGDFQYTEKITLSDTITRKTDYSLTIKPNLRITKLNKYSVEGQWEFPGLEQEFPNITVINGFSYFQQLSPKEKRKKNLKKYGLIALNIIEDSALLYGGIKLGQKLESNKPF